MTSKYCKIMVIILTICVFAAAMPKRSRGAGLFYCESANTVGAGNIWTRLYGTGYIWDNNTADNLPKIFPNAKIKYGVTDFLELELDSRIITYGFQPGSAAFRGKLTTPNNKKLKLFRAGLQFSAEKGFYEEFPSVGFRAVTEGGGVGFNSEGFENANMKFVPMFCADLDFISVFSTLPIKLYFNFGKEFGGGEEFSYLNMYRFKGGIEYKGLYTEMFIEYKLDAFDNFSKPVIVHDLSSNPYDTFRVFFEENPSYVTGGANVKYENGIKLTGAVSILLSKNVKENHGLVRPVIKTSRTTINQGFSPFFADWKLCGAISFPLRFKITSSEMVRYFLLRKNRNRKKKIDIFP
ncbi:MAG: hypothetical protein ACLFQK_01140 [Fibrobacterota bacterium]